MTIMEKSNNQFALPPPPLPSIHNRQFKLAEGGNKFVFNNNNNNNSIR